MSNLKQLPSDLRKNGKPKKYRPARYGVRRVAPHLCRPYKLANGDYVFPDTTELYIIPASHE